MQTLKTAVVVVLLLVVFYGVYETLNRAPDAPPPAVAQLPPAALADVDIDMGVPLAARDATSPFDPATAVPPAAEERLTMAPPESRIPPSLYDSSAAPAAHPPLGEMPPQRPESVSGPAPGSAATLPPQGTYPIPSAAMATLPPDPRLQSNPFFGEQVASPMDTPRSAGQGHVGARAYQNALKLAKSQIGAGDHAAALATLSVFFRSEDLTPEEHRELVDLLDPLAARVVYSREHLLERPYSVRRNETLADIAQQYNVPAPLLQKINGIENPNVLLPGSELKVVQGPFRADVDLKSQELTLFLDRLYAGRFPIALGIDPQPIEGQFQVRDKRPGKTFFSLDGRTIPEESPSNPFGRAWLDLGNEVCIHGSPAEGGGQNRGCISLSPRDADDVYGILSVGSQVRILR